MATVLVVEDEFAIAKLLGDVLDEEGYRVLIASNGKQALELAKSTEPDLVLTDYMMPVMDGAALIQAMANTSLSKVPIVMMSSMPEQALADRCGGYVHFIRKPFSIFQVIEAVARFTSPKR